MKPDEAARQLAGRVGGAVQRETGPYRSGNERRRTDATRARELRAGRLVSHLPEPGHDASHRPCSSPRPSAQAACLSTHRSSWTSTARPRHLSATRLCPLAARPSLRHPLLVDLGPPQGQTANSQMHLAFLTMRMKRLRTTLHNHRVDGLEPEIR